MWESDGISALLHAFLASSVDERECFPFRLSRRSLGEELLVLIGCDSGSATGVVWVRW